MELSYYYKSVLPVAGLIVVGFAGVGLNILFKAASVKGLSYFVFLFYTYFLNTLLLLPVPFFLWRRSMIPMFKFPLISRLCIVAAIGFFSQYMGYKGIKYSSPTMASVMSNLTPAWTFIFALLFRMEKLALKSSVTQSKIIGTILSIIGALVAVFYSGPAILTAQSKTLLPISPHNKMVAAHPNWAIGGTLLAAQHILYALIFIVQTQMMKICPSALLLTFFSYAAITMISAPVCFIAEREWDSWKLKPDVTLVTIAYSGIFGGAAISVIHMWCLHIKGPIYVVSFLPSSIAIAAVMSFLLLGEDIHLGSVIGGVIIAGGVYGVMWGQAREEKVRDKSAANQLDSIEQNPPLNIGIHDDANHQPSDSHLNHPQPAN